MTLIELLSQLVAIDSVNPALVAHAAGERAIADFVSQWLQAHGIAVTEVPCAERGLDRPSLLCRVAGTGGGRSLMLYAQATRWASQA